MPRQTPIHLRLMSQCFPSLNFTPMVGEKKPHPAISLSLNSAKYKVNLFYRYFPLESKVENKEAVSVLHKFKDFNQSYSR